jgi:hypothetical protein
MNEEVKKILQSPTCSVDEWRTHLFPCSKNAAYQAVERGEVEAIRIGGKIRIITAPWRRKLGLDEQVAA